MSAITHQFIQCLPGVTQAHCSDHLHNVCATVVKYVTSLSSVNIQTFKLSARQLNIDWARDRYGISKLPYYPWIGNEALTQGGEHHHEDALRAVHLQVLDGDAITTSLVRVGPRAAVTSLLRDLCRPSILVY